MKESFNKIFWGFLLVLIEIHLIVVDVLPDPLGYFFIYVGVQALAKHNTVGRKAEYISLILIIVSIPTIFIQNSSINGLGHVNPFNMWSIYMIVMGLCKLVLVFYVFKLMLAFAKEHDNLYLVKRTISTFKIYLVVMLLNQFLQSFVMNLTSEAVTVLTIIMLISSLVLEITFLVLLRKFRDIEDRNKGNYSSNTNDINIY